MDEIHSALQKFPDVESHKALLTLESVRRELKARGGDSFINSRLLLSTLQRRLSNTRVPPTEEVSVGVLNVLADFVGCMDSELLGGVSSVFADAVPHFGKENVRRAASALIGGFLKRAPVQAQDLCAPLVAKGLKAESETTRRGCLQLVGDAVRLSTSSRGGVDGGRGLDPAPFIAPTASCLATSGPASAMMAAAQRALGRMRSADPLGYLDSVRALEPSLYSAVLSSERAIARFASSSAGGVGVDGPSSRPSSSSTTLPPSIPPQSLAVNTGQGQGGVRGVSSMGGPPKMAPMNGQKRPSPQGSSATSRALDLLLEGEGGDSASFFSSSGEEVKGEGEVPTPLLAATSSLPPFVQGSGRPESRAPPHLLVMEALPQGEPFLDALVLERDVIAPTPVSLVPFVTPPPSLNKSEAGGIVESSKSLSHYPTFLTPSLASLDLVGFEGSEVTDATSAAAENFLARSLERERQLAAMAQVQSSVESALTWTPALSPRPKRAGLAVAGESAVSQLQESVAVDGEKAPRPSQEGSKELSEGKASMERQSPIAIDSAVEVPRSPITTNHFGSSSDEGGQEAFESSSSTFSTPSSTFKRSLNLAAQANPASSKGRSTTPLSPPIQQLPHILLDSPFHEPFARVTVGSSVFPGEKAPRQLPSPPFLLAPRLKDGGPAGQRPTGGLPPITHEGYSSVGSSLQGEEGYQGGNLHNSPSLHREPSREKLAAASLGLTPAGREGVFKALSGGLSNDEQRGGGAFSRSPISTNGDEFSKVAAEGGLGELADSAPFIISDRRSLLSHTSAQPSSGTTSFFPPSGTFTPQGVPQPLTATPVELRGRTPIRGVRLAANELQARRGDDSSTTFSHTASDLPLPFPSPQPSVQVAGSFQTDGGLSISPLPAPTSVIRSGLELLKRRSSRGAGSRRSNSASATGQGGGGVWGGLPSKHAEQGYMGRLLPDGSQRAADVESGGLGGHSLEEDWQPSLSSPAPSPASSKTSSPYKRSGALSANATMGRGRSLGRRQGSGLGLSYSGYEGGQEGSLGASDFVDSGTEFGSARGKSMEEYDSLPSIHTHMRGLSRSSSTTKVPTRGSRLSGVNGGGKGFTLPPSYAMNNGGKDGVRRASPVTASSLSHSQANSPHNLLYFSPPQGTFFTPSLAPMPSLSGGSGGGRHLGGRNHYDADALTEEFGSDPYIFNPPSPFKDPMPSPLLGQGGKFAPGGRLSPLALPIERSHPQQHLVGVNSTTTSAPSRNTSGRQGRLHHALSFGSNESGHGVEDIASSQVDYEMGGDKIAEAVPHTSRSHPLSLLRRSGTLGGSNRSIQSQGGATTLSTHPNTANSSANTSASSRMDTASSLEGPPIVVGDDDEGGIDLDYEGVGYLGKGGGRSGVHSGGSISGGGLAAARLRRAASVEEFVSGGIEGGSSAASVGYTGDEGAYVGEGGEPNSPMLIPRKTFSAAPRLGGKGTWVRSQEANTLLLAPPLPPTLGDNSTEEGLGGSSYSSSRSARRSVSRTRRRGLSISGVSGLGGGGNGLGLEGPEAFPDSNPPSSYKDGGEPRWGHGGIPGGSDDEWSSVGGGLPSSAPNTEKLYVPASSLQRLANPSGAMAAALEALSSGPLSEDWESQFEAFTAIRRCAMHHSDFLLSSPALIHDLVLKALPLADSPRSSLAKGALMAFEDMFASPAGRALDSELEAISSTLVRRVSDTNEFIATAAVGALASLIDNYNSPTSSTAASARCLAAIMGAAGHKNATVRMGAAPWLERATQGAAWAAWGGGGVNPRMGLPVFKDSKKLVALAVRYVGAGAPEVRYAGIRTLALCLQCTNAIDEKSLARQLSDKSMAKVREVAKAVASGDFFAASHGAGGEGGMGGQRPPSHSSTFQASAFSSLSSASSAAGMSMNSSGAWGDNFSVHSDDGRRGVRNGSGVVSLTAAETPTRMLRSRGPARIPPLQHFKHSSPQLTQEYKGEELEGSGSFERGTSDPSGAPFLGTAAKNKQSLPLKDMGLPTYARSPYSVLIAGGGGGEAAMSTSGVVRSGTGAGRSARIPSSNNTSLASSGSSKLGGNGEATLSSLSSTAPPDSSHITAGTSMVAEELDGVLLRMVSSDWRERVSSLGELTSFAGRERQVTLQHLLKVATGLSARLEDSNARVLLAATHSVGAFTGGLRGEGLDKVIPVLLPGLSTCLVSAQRPVSEAASLVFERLLSSCDPGAALGPLLGQLKASSNPRVRVIMLEKLGGLLPSLHARRPTAVIRHALPAVFALLDESKPDVKTGATDALLRAASVIGKEGVLEAARAASLSEALLTKIKKALK